MTAETSFAPLALPDDLPPAPSHVPAWSLPGGVLHGDKACHHLARSRGATSTNIALDGTTPTRDLHCRGREGTWADLTAHLLARTPYDRVNVVAEAAWQGDPDAAIRLRAISDPTSATNRLDLAMSGDRPTRDAIRTYAATQLALLADSPHFAPEPLLIALITDLLAHVRFNTEAGRSGISDTLGAYGLLTLQEGTHAGTDGLVPLRDLARAWCGHGRDQLTAAAETIASEVTAKVEDWNQRGLGPLSYGDLGSTDPETIANLIEEGFTTYLNTLVTGPTATVEMPTSSRLDHHFTRSAFLAYHATVTPSTITFQAPMAAVITLVRLDIINPRTATITENGVPLTEVAIWARAHVAETTERDEIREWSDRVDAAEQTHRQKMQAQKAHSIDAQFAIARADWRNLDETQARAIAHQLVQYTTGREDPTITAAIDDLLTPIPTGQRREYLHCLLTNAHGRDDALELVFDTEPATITDTHTLLGRDAVLGGDPGLRAAATARAIAVHRNEAPTWAARITTLTTPQRHVTTPAPRGRTRPTIAD